MGQKLGMRWEINRTSPPPTPLQSPLQVTCTEWPELLITVKSVINGSSVVSRTMSAVFGVFG